MIITGTPAKRKATMSSPPAQKRKLSPDYVVEDSDEAEQPNDSEHEEQEKGKMKKNEEGEPYFELTDKRRVTVRRFKGNVLVDIREYWEPEPGKMAPGKKGISLNRDQWTTLKSMVDDIESAIKTMK